MISSSRVEASGLHVRLAVKTIVAALLVSALPVAVLAQSEPNGPIKQQFTKPRVSDEKPGELRGILRAVHLDEDWLEVTVADGQHVRIFEVGETVDDLVGPLVNHEVLVQIVTTARNRVLFRDIERAP